MNSPVAKSTQARETEGPRGERVLEVIANHSFRTLAKHGNLTRSKTGSDRLMRGSFLGPLILRAWGFEVVEKVDNCQVVKRH